MVQYKLYYFDSPGRAEQIRLMFHYVGQAFEDIRFTKAEWPSHKSKFMFGHVPVLEVDGKQLAQSDVICQYLAGVFGLAGKDDWEKIKAAELVDFGKDVANELRPYFVVKMGYKEGDEAALRKEVLVPALQKFLPLYDKLLAQSGSGFFLPSGITYADFILFVFLGLVKRLGGEEQLKAHPKLGEFIGRMEKLPQLQSYLSAKK